MHEGRREDGPGEQEEAMGNVWWSDRANDEYRLQHMRPAYLPSLDNWSADLESAGKGVGKTSATSAHEPRVGGEPEYFHIASPGPSSARESASGTSNGLGMGQPVHMPVTQPGHLLQSSGGVMVESARNSSRDHDVGQQDLRHSAMAASENAFLQMSSQDLRQMVEQNRQADPLLMALMRRLEEAETRTRSTSSMFSIYDNPAETGGRSRSAVQVESSRRNSEGGLGIGYGDVGVRGHRDTVVGSRTDMVVGGHRDIGVGEVVPVLQGQQVGHVEMHSPLQQSLWPSASVASNPLMTPCQYPQSTSLPLPLPPFSQLYSSSLQSRVAETDQRLRTPGFGVEGGCSGSTGFEPLRGFQGQGLEGRGPGVGSTWFEMTPPHSQPWPQSTATSSGFVGGDVRGKGLGNFSREPQRPVVEPGWPWDSAAQVPPLPKRQERTRSPEPLSLLDLDPVPVIDQSQRSTSSGLMTATSEMPLIDILSPKRTPFRAVSPGPETPRTPRVGT